MARSGADGRAVAILDVDGTLVDTNYQHVLAWYRALRQQAIVVPAWRIHRHIGMGGDQIVTALAGEEFERQLGDDVRAAERALYLEMIGEVEPMPDARRLIEELRGRGWPVILASSATAEEVDHYVELLGARELVDGWTTSADVEATKPEPDLVFAALDKAGADAGVLLGDSTWDGEAARRAGLPSIGMLTGGFCEQELADAGASAVFESIAQLLAALDQTQLASPRGFSRASRSRA